MRNTALLLAAVTLAACSSSEPAPAPPPLQQQPASSTGSLAFVVAGGATKLYFPAADGLTTTQALLAVVNAAAANNTVGLLHYLDLGVPGAARAVGGDGADIVALHRDDPTIFFVDAATDAVAGSAPLPPEALPFTLSTGSPYYTTGAAVDSVGRKAYVSVSGGLVAFDLDSRAPTGSFAAPPSEGFALDAASGWLYAAYYPCTPPSPPDPDVCFAYTRPASPNPTDGLSFIDLGTGAATPLYDGTALNDATPLGLEADAVAVDLSLDLAVVAVNGPPALQLLDLRTQAFDVATASYGAARMTIGMPDSEYTVLAADQATHLLMAAQENGGSVVFLDLVKARSGIVTYLDVMQMPPLPDGSDWVTHGDVHGAAIGIVGGRPYAFLLQNMATWIARIDLQGVAEVLAGQGTFASKVAYISVPPPP